MNFCKKCGEKLENGTCPICVSNTNQVFCRKCGTEFKKPLSSNQKKLIICSCALLVVCVGSFFGFKVYKDKLQDNYAKEAISLIEDGDFEGADEVLKKYKKDDVSILELKKLNTFYLEVAKECNEGDSARLDLLNNAVLKNAHSGSYVDEIVKLKLIGEKLSAIDSLSNVDTFLSIGNIETARDFIDVCNEYDLTEEEKAKVSEVNAKIDAVADKLQKEEIEKKKEEDKQKKEEAANALNSSFKERYRSLSNDYNDSFYDSMSSGLSEAEKSSMLRDIALTWDRLLNDIWKHLQTTMEPSKFETLKKAQIKWVDEKMKVEKEENIWGMSANAFAQSKWSTLGEMNKERVKFLIDNHL